MSASVWEPAVRIDLETVSSMAFQEAMAAFAAWATTVPLQPLDLINGWHEITPEIAENLLRRNDGNRRVSLATVRKYFHAMKIGEWKPTGQPILVNTAGSAQDCQHRAWACYFGGVSFPSYVVTDVQPMKDLFAYIDDMKPRSAADALYTAGNNGQAAVTAAAIKLASAYDENKLSILKSTTAQRLTIHEVLEYSRSHPELAETAHLLAGTYKRAVAIIHNKAAAAFFAWRAIATHGLAVVDGFLSPLGTGAHLDEDDPTLVLRSRLLNEAHELKTSHVLALVIKGFNMHIAGKKVSKGGVYVRDNEKFPRIEAPLSEAA